MRQQLDEGDGELGGWRNGAGDRRVAGLRDRSFERVEAGGTACRTCNHKRGTGLSPRVRGNHEHALGGPQKIGSIPAGAGEPML